MRSVFRLLKRLTHARSGAGLYGGLKVELRRQRSSNSVQQQRVGASSGTGVGPREELLIDQEVDRYLHRILDPDGTVVRGSATKRKTRTRTSRLRRGARLDR